MNHADLPQRWKERLVQWIREFSSDQRTELGASDFPSSYRIRIEFDDGSRAEFQYARLIEEPLFQEIGVFTEHCGYHIFPLGGTHVTRIEE